MSHLPYPISVRDLSIDPTPKRRPNQYFITEICWLGIHYYEEELDFCLVSDFSYYAGIGILCVLVFIVGLYYVGVLYGLCGERPGHGAPCCNTGTGANFLMAWVLAEIQNKADLPFIKILFQAIRFFLWNLLQFRCLESKFRFIFSLLEIWSRFLYKSDASLGNSNFFLHIQIFPDMHSDFVSDRSGRFR